MTAHKIPTGTAPADRLLNVIVEKGLQLTCRQRDAWLAGEISFYLPYTFLANAADIPQTQLVTMLNFLQLCGYLKYDRPVANAGAYFRLTLPAEALVA